MGYWGVIIAMLFALVASCDWGDWRDRKPLPPIVAVEDSAGEAVNVAVGKVDQAAGEVSQAQEAEKALGKQIEQHEVEIANLLEKNENVSESWRKLKASYADLNTQLDQAINAMLQAQHEAHKAAGVAKQKDAENAKRIEREKALENEIKIVSVDLAKEKVKVVKAEKANEKLKVYRNIVFIIAGLLTFFVVFRYILPQALATYTKIIKPF